MNGHFPRGASPITATHIGGLRVLQWNMQHSLLNFDLLSPFLKENRFDILLIQDPPECLKEGRLFLKGFSVFLPSKGGSVSSSFSDGPLVAILASSSLKMRQIDFNHNRACGILVSTLIGSLAMMSAYIHYQNAEGLNDLSRFLSLTRSLSTLFLIGAEANGDSRWWGPPHQISNDTRIRMEEFIPRPRLFDSKTLAVLSHVCF